MSEQIDPRAGEEREESGLLISSEPLRAAAQFDSDTDGSDVMGGDTDGTDSTDKADTDGTDRASDSDGSDAGDVIGIDAADGTDATNGGSGDTDASDARGVGDRDTTDD